MHNITEQNIFQLVTSLRPDLEAELQSSSSLVTDFIFDSLDILSIISALESEYGIKCEIDEIVPKNFNSIAAITALAQRKATS